MVVDPNATQAAASDLPLKEAIDVVTEAKRQTQPKDHVRRPAGDRLAMRTVRLKAPLWVYRHREPHPQIREQVTPTALERPYDAGAQRREQQTPARMLALPKPPPLRQRGQIHVEHDGRDPRTSHRTGPVQQRDHVPRIIHPQATNRSSMRSQWGQRGPTQPSYRDRSGGRHASIALQ